MKWFTVRIEREAESGDPMEPTVVYTGMDSETAAEAYAGFREACLANRSLRSGIHCYMECRDAATGALLSRCHTTLRAGQVDEANWVRDSTRSWAAA